MSDLAQGDERTGQVLRSTYTASSSEIRTTRPLHRV